MYSLVSQPVPMPHMGLNLLYYYQSWQCGYFLISSATTSMPWVGQWVEGCVTNYNEALMLVSYLP